MFKMIKPPTDYRSGKKPSLYRACVNGDRAEYEKCEEKIMEAYRKANGPS